MEDFADVRTVKDFRLTTFSGYQKTKVRDEVMKAIHDVQIENACYWTAELVASGHFQELWDALFTFFAKYIHIGNARLVIYLRERYGIYYDLTKKQNSITGSTISLLELRNMLPIRKLFTEVVCVLSFSIRKPSLALIRLPCSSNGGGRETDDVNDLDLDNSKSKKTEIPVWELLSKSLPNRESENQYDYRYLGSSTLSDNSYPENKNKIAGKSRMKSRKNIHIFHKDFLMERVSAPNKGYYYLKRSKDPEEWFIALNEMSYQLSSERRNMLEACFWLEWLLEYDAYCRCKATAALCQAFSEESIIKHDAIDDFGKSATLVKEKGIGKGEPRTEFTHGLIESKYEGDVIWSVWELLFSELDKKVDRTSVLILIMKAAHILFCIDYKTTALKRKKYLLYFAVSLITENIPLGGLIIGTEQRDIVKRVVGKTDDIYVQLKASEQRPQTDYLMNGLKTKTSREETVSALEAMQRADMFQLNRLGGRG